MRFMESGTNFDVGPRLTPLVRNPATVEFRRI